MPISGLGALRCLQVALLAAAIGVALNGCQVHEPRSTLPPPVPLPADFSHSGDTPLSDQWWKEFADPHLNALIERAFRDNLDLRQAWARLVQAEALARQSAADLYPRITGTGDAARSRTVASGGPLGTGQSTTNRFSLGLAASYEADLWGRIRSLRRAANLDLKATQEDLDTTAMSLTARVAETWYALIEQQAQLNLLAEQMETSRTFLDLTELRFSQGQASALDVYQQRQQLAGTEGQLPPARARLSVLQHQLAALLGAAPTSAIAHPHSELPELALFPDVGVPAELLARRPDVRAAHLRVTAADSRLGAAVADRFPAIRISASSIYQASTPGLVFNDWLWSLAAGLTAPIFEGGRKAAEVDRSKGVVEERLAQYGQVVLAALHEVEDAIVQEREQREFVASIKRQVELAHATLEQARSRYMNGLSDYLPVLTALQVLQRQQRDLLTARRQLIGFRIQLYRALGGSWSGMLEANRPAFSKSGDAK